MRSSLTLPRSAAAMVALLVAAGALVVLPSANADTSTNISHVLAGANVALGQVCVHSTYDGSWFKRTGQAKDNDDGENPQNPTGVVRDITVGTDVTHTMGPNQAYFGASAKFDKLVFDVFTPGVAGNVYWKYWAGDAKGWVTMSSTTDQLQDPSDSFKPTLPGVVWMSFRPPDDWAKKALPNPCQGGGGGYYYILAETHTEYVTYVPEISQASARLYNAHVTVKSESGKLLGGIDQSRFDVEGGSNSTIIGFKEAASGEYDLALIGSGPAREDYDYNVSASNDGYVASGKVATGRVAEDSLVSLSQSLVLKYPLKVLVNDDLARPVNNAVVKLSGRDPSDKVGNASYFAEVAGGSLSVTAQGYQSLSVNDDTKLQNINPGITAPITIFLSGTASCAGGSSISAGSNPIEVRCRGLKSPGGSSSSSTSSSSSRATSGAAAGAGSDSGGGTDSPAISSNAPEATHRVGAQLTRPDGVYRADIGRVTKDTVFEINLQDANDPLIDSLTLTFSEAADDVSVVVERSNQLDPLLGVPTPGGTIYGFLQIKVFVGGELRTDLVDTTALHFSVDTKTLDEYKQSPTGVRLLRHNGAEWKSLQTVPLGREGKQYAFSATGPGNGVYAIYGDAVKPVAPGLPWGPLALGVVLINLAVGAVLYARRERPRAQDYLQ